jgi:hypothetical protein
MGKKEYAKIRLYMIERLALLGLIVIIGLAGLIFGYYLPAVGSLLLLSVVMK